jgi:hypothetical protein
VKQRPWASPLRAHRKLGDVNDVFGAPQFVVEEVADVDPELGRAPTGNALKIEKSTFHCAGRRKWFRSVFPKPATSRPLGCENLVLS